MTDNSAGQKMAQRATYEDYHRRYDPRLMRRFVIRRKSILKKYYDPETAKRVLDIGCGEGWMVKELEGKGGKIFGIDIAYANVKFVKASIPEAAVLQADAERLPFKDNIFDLVFLNGVFHHVPSHMALVNEIIRVLSPEGWAAIIEPNKLNPFYAWQALLKDHEKGLFSLDMKRLYLALKKTLDPVFILPFNHYDFPYHGFPPKWCERIVDAIHSMPPGNILNTHYMIAGKKK